MLVRLTLPAFLSLFAAVAWAQSPSAGDVPGEQPPTSAEDGTASETGADVEATAADSAAAADGEAPVAEADPGSGEPALHVIVIDAAPYGVDPVVGRAVTEQMRQTAQALGYGTISPEGTVAAAQRLAMPYPPAPADLWRVTFVAEANRGAFARVWAHEGQYVFELSVASLDGAGPFFARGTSGAEDLREVVDRLTREALPSPDSYDAEAATRLAHRDPEAAPAGPAFQTPPARAPAPRVVVRRRPRRSLRPTRRFDLVLQTEGAIGTSSDGFYNHLVGFRVGLRITNAIHLGLYGAYANLNGRGGRTSNFLTMLLVEDRIRLSSRSDITVPVRFGVGYLPFNGPVIRLSAGVNFPLSPRVELGIDVLTPTFWFLPERTVVSLNLAAEVVFRLGSATTPEPAGDARPATESEDEPSTPDPAADPEDSEFENEFDSEFND